MCGHLGRNGCGKTTLFRILTGEIGYDEGEVYVNPNKKLGSSPRFPGTLPGIHGWRRCSAPLHRKLLERRWQRMEELESQMTASTPKRYFKRIRPAEQPLCRRGGYDMDVDTDKVCNGLGIPETMRQQEFDMLSGGEKDPGTWPGSCWRRRRFFSLTSPPTTWTSSVEWLEAYINRFKGTVLTISPRPLFLDQVGDRIVEISAGGRASSTQRNYSFYMEKSRPGSICR